MLWFIVTNEGYFYNIFLFPDVLFFFLFAQKQQIKKHPFFPASKYIPRWNFIQHLDTLYFFITQKAGGHFHKNMTSQKLIKTLYFFKKCILNKYTKQQ